MNSELQVECYLQLVNFSRDNGTIQHLLSERDQINWFHGIHFDWESRNFYRTLLCPLSVISLVLVPIVLACALTGAVLTSLIHLPRRRESFACTLLFYDFASDIPVVVGQIAVFNILEHFWSLPQLGLVNIGPYVRGIQSSVTLAGLGMGKLFVICSAGKRLLDDCWPSAAKSIEAVVNPHWFAMVLTAFHMLKTAALHWLSLDFELMTGTSAFPYVYLAARKTEVVQRLLLSDWLFETVLQGLVYILTAALLLKLCFAKHKSMDRQRSLLIICQSGILLTLDLFNFFLQRRLASLSGEMIDYCAEVGQQLRVMQKNDEMLKLISAALLIPSFRFGLYFYPMLCLDSSFRNAVSALFRKRRGVTHTD